MTGFDRSLETMRERSSTDLPDHENMNFPTPIRDVSRMGQPSCTTTFGIEFEFVLAFHEDMLASVMSEYNIDATVVKDLTEYQHRNLLGRYARHPIANAAYDERLRYPSWALHVPESDVICSRELHRDMFVSSISGDRQWLRRYVMEPLLVTKRCLESAGLSCNAVGWIEPDPHHLDDNEKAKVPFSGQGRDVMMRSSDVDYSQWTIANDHTLIGALRSQLSDHLAKRGVPVAHMTHWDSAGIELLCPVFRLDEKAEAFRQIQRYMNALDGKPTCMMESVWASTHVHVGFDFERPEDIPMSLLQHLAYILVVHEDLLSKCHPKSRSGVERPKGLPLEVDRAILDDEDFDPEEEAFTETTPPPTEEELDMENEGIVLAIEAEYTGGDNVESNARYLRTKLRSHSHQSLLDATRDAIFMENGNIFDLVKLLRRPKDPLVPDGHRHRGYIYNFANLWALAKNDTPWKPIKPTVEFRQHACTTDVVVIKHWVTLIEAIVRMAESKATSTMQANGTFAEREASKYPSSWPYDNVPELCVTFLGLDEEEGSYWQRSFELYKDDRTLDDAMADSI
ncbi:hypothetical protein LTR10_022381 [Elasticomyces elasticus]|uniref:GS catalytic domain-containing protein n=1 Tax=Exophiala sideris TaxID=1016849 RepID=A0ABR0J7Z8_9EURO|nr:hypothetical protein LTR10_022381 [Elasticomyces elasticus]KAK5029548.1 hypothetical protein LTS07_006011 [Exophiala sideris]KAK5036758.1 hypothetical protein LTR13_005138 [Exophiala sideris]KAK5058177.1 hypothetical protein LTR69_007175 [Exophiala sideris]KAK5182137.1 hypothetical protein LTR44_005738 [Eurotiomycetes sp. CCFEE 6388]